MHILFLTSHFPYPPQSGGALRADGLINGAVAAGYQVSLFCFAEIPPSGTPLHKRCMDIITAKPPTRHLSDRLRDIALTRHADMARRFWSDEALDQLKDYLATHTVDLIHAESIEMAVYLLPIHAWYPDLPLIYGSLNAEADLQRTVFRAERGNPKRLAGTIYSWIQWRRLSVLERRICQTASAVLAVSEPDQALLQAMSDTPVALVKNGITTADYAHIQPNDALGDKAIVFTGSMDYRPNVDAVLWFIDQILPHLSADTYFYIVGHRPHPRLLALQSHPQITLTGRVDDITPYWAGAKVYVAPLRMGSGTRFKILEAMASGCAVVSTTIGAQGLGVTSGQELILADTPTAFAAAIEGLLENPAQREALGQAGRQFVQHHFDWSVIVPRLLEVYRQFAPAQPHQ